MSQAPRIPIMGKLGAFDYDSNPGPILCVFDTACAGLLGLHGFTIVWFTHSQNLVFYSVDLSLLFWPSKVLGVTINKADGMIY